MFCCVLFPIACFGVLLLQSFTVFNTEQRGERERERGQERESISLFIFIEEEEKTKERPIRLLLLPVCWFGKSRQATSRIKNLSPSPKHFASCGFHCFPF